MSEVAGQLSEVERHLLTEAITLAPKKPETVIEVGTWLGGGSTLHILRALEKNGVGHLWGIEADRSIYARMVGNIRTAVPEAVERFTPLFGFSHKVLPQWIKERGRGAQVDFAFLDGGNNPREQIAEFRLLDPIIPVGGQLMAHDAKLRKGKWLGPFVSSLDNWETRLHNVSEEGLFFAKKNAPHPSAASLRAAQHQLLRMQCQPAEIAAAILPSPICGFCLRLLPRRFSRQLAEGRG
ncbi:MAG: class I SAM-dependent methyltransferase [Limisphaerales bacterium]